MPLAAGDLMFVGFDADNNTLAFVATVNVDPGEVIMFTDREWNGTNFNGNEHFVEWTTPAGGIDAGTVVQITLDNPTDSVSFDIGGTAVTTGTAVGLGRQNEMYWAFQGPITAPTNFIAVIGNEADGPFNRSPDLTGTGLTTSNGAIIIDGDEDYMEYTGDVSLPDPVFRQDLIDDISDLSNWTTADGGGNQNPGGTYDVTVPTVICFCARTRLKVPGGDRAAGDLRAGDLVMTCDHGAQPVRWVGQRRVAAQGRFAPIRFAPGAIGNRRPLRLSPQHRVLVRGWRAELLFGAAEILVPAIRLVNGDTITRQPGGTITYVHILFDLHQIVLAEGAPCESFFPGHGGLSAVSPQMYDELTALFPELITDPARYGDTARMVIANQPARLLTC